jgi:cell wall assembly regulator SMI1
VTDAERKEAERRLLQALSRETPEGTADSLTRLDRWLAANRPDYYAMFRPGLADTDLDEFERHFGVKLPDSFRACYRWRDGQEEGCYDSIQDNFMFMPLASIRSSKELLDGMIGHDFESPDWWRREWVPFLDNGGGDHMCLDLAPAAEGLGPVVRRFWHDMPGRPVLHLSFEAWVGVLVESMESGEYEVV